MRIDAVEGVVEKVFGFLVSCVSTRGGTKLERENVKKIIIISTLFLFSPTEERQKHSW